MNQTNVTSVDFVPEVVKKMQERNVSGVTYAEMDFFNMTYEDNSFDVVIDKGSFDAICLDDDPESEAKYTKYLSEQVRVLDSTTNGKFLIVSLLQGHVFTALLDYFIRGKNNPHFENYVCDLQLNKLDKICNVKDSKFVSYLLCITKRAKSADSAAPKLTLKMGMGQEPESVEEEAL